MVARSTRGTIVYMTTADATATTITPTDITGAAPAVVEAATADLAEVDDGDLVVVPASATGMAGLDGQMFVASGKDATSFELLGSNADGQTYTPGSTPGLLLYDTSDMVSLCLASLTRNAGTASTTSVGTYCDPTATISSAVVEAGTIDATGYVDVTQPDFQELVKAYDDGDERQFMVVLPGDNGYLLFSGVVTTFDYDIPVDGALGYNFTITLSGRPVHRF